MDALLFLAGAVVVTVLGAAFLAWRNREPKGDHHGITEFRRNMKALSPEERRAVDEPSGVRIIDRSDGES
ncbi:MAG TPA: hypothetical protein VF855_08040 [Acidimicrobiales bacterium]